MIKQLIFLTFCLLSVPVNGMQSQKNNSSIDDNKFWFDAAIKIIGEKFPKKNKPLLTVLIPKKNGTIEQLLLNRSDTVSKIKFVLSTYVRSNDSTGEKALITIMLYAGREFVLFCKAQDEYLSACNDGDLTSSYLKRLIGQLLIKNAYRIVNKIKKNKPKKNINFYDIYYIPNRLRQVDLNTTPLSPKQNMKHLSSTQKETLEEILKTIIGKHPNSKKIYYQPKNLQSTIYRNEQNNGLHNLLLHPET